MSNVASTAGRPVPQAVPFGRRIRTRGSGPGTATSAVVHAGLIAVLVWATGPRFVKAGLGPGEGSGGGGGGGGGSAIAAVSIALGGRPPAPPPVVVEAPQTLAVPAQVEPLPELEVVPDSAPVEPAAQPAAEQATREGPGAGPGQGSGTGPGTGGGSGGGSGGGVGTGIGPGTGPGTGGGGGSVFPPQPVGMILPPPDRPGELRGVRLTVTFFISERGQVVDVEIDPPIRNRGYRAEFLERMRRYTFTPAYTRDGRAVAAEYEVHFTL